MKKRTFILPIIVLILMMLLYLIADYMNILDLVSLKTDRFNVGFFAVFVDNIIVLTIAVMTYYVIDKKAVYRQHN